MPKTNIRGDLRKYKQQQQQSHRSVKPKPSINPEQQQVVVQDFIPGIVMKIGLQVPATLKQLQQQQHPMEPEIEATTETKLLISPFKRTVYFGECGHKAHTYINTVTLNSYYYCVQCVLFRKISEVVY